MNIVKAIARLLLLLGFTLGVAIDVWATPVTFTPDLSGSSVTVTDTACWANIKGNLVLDGSTFTLADGNTQTLDFFTLTASGFGLGTYNVVAKLAFLTPSITGSGNGSGIFGTIFGLISGGTLSWDPKSLPDYFTLPDGNTIEIDFEDGCKVVLGGKTTVKAYVTNMGGGTAENSNTTVPEPLTIVLLGAGLLSLGFCWHRR